MRKILLSIVCAFLIFATNAAAGGLGNTTVVIPNQTSGTNFVASGCGWGTGYDIIVYLDKDEVNVLGYATHTDANGCWSYSSNYLLTPGFYSFYVFRIKPSGGQTGRYKLNHPDADIDFAVS